VAVEDGRLRAAERNVLMLELHDVIVHQLSNASLQVMSQSNGDDPGELREVLRRVGDSTESALAELRLLARVGRDDPAATAGTDAIGELSQRLSPTEAVTRWGQRLLDAGFEPVISFPDQADRLRMTVQGTLVRAMDATGDNILQHARARSRCAIPLRVNAKQVLLEVTSALRTATMAEGVPLGRSLRSLRERVDLTGGGFRAGPSLSASGDGEWVVGVLLPQD